MKEFAELEQKAKRYDEALEKAKRLYEKGTITESLCHIFPELKEREDEKIRKLLIRLFTSNANEKFDDVSTQEIIAWLEKQSSNNIKWNKNTKDNKPQVNHSVLMQTINGIAEGEWQGEQWHQYRWAGIVRDSDVLSWIELYDIEKQGEQKPADKPKFHKGEWIVWQDKCYKVNYNGCGYELVDQNGLSTSLEYGTVEESAHLWTIQDAKDGDLIYVSTEEKGIQAIFHKFENGFIYFHCFLCGDFTQGGYEPIGDIELVYPLQKTHHQRFFQKMKEAGYEWDGENKELKKLGQQCEVPVTINIDKMVMDYTNECGNDGFGKPLNCMIRAYRQCLTDAICTLTLANKKTTDKVEQEPTKWTEEDECYMSECIGAIATKDGWSFEEKRKTKKWLKSLKQRIGG